MDRDEIVDRLRGMFIGAFLGDAWGAPYEFRTSAKLEYTEKFTYSTEYTTRFQGTRVLEPGQVTDDSEMTLALLRQVLEDRRYIKNNVILAYLEWANSGVWMMGKNTRALLKGVKTVKGYNARVAKSKEKGERSEANGSMMRASPLVLFTDFEVIEDTCLTNDNQVNTEFDVMYVTMLRLALKGNSYQDIYDYVRDTDIDEEMFADQRDIVTNKGWIKHAMWCCLAIGNIFDSDLNGGEVFRHVMNWVIGGNRGSDTDTNACIVGALIGAIVGYNGLLMDDIVRENIEIMMSRKPASGSTPRPEKYHPGDIFDLVEEAADLFIANHQ